MFSIQPRIFIPFDLRPFCNLENDARAGLVNYDFIRGAFKNLVDHSTCFADSICSAAAHIGFQLVQFSSHYPGKQQDNLGDIGTDNLPGQFV